MSRPATGGAGAASLAAAERDPIGAAIEGQGPPLAAPDPTAEQITELAPLYGAAIAVLTWGFRGGAALLAAGIALALARREPLNREADPFGEVLPAVLDGRAAGVVDLAILWFMLAPVAAVAVAAAGFLRLADRRYALVSLLVLAVLAASIALAL